MVEANVTLPAKNSPITTRTRKMVVLHHCWIKSAPGPRPNRPRQWRVGALPPVDPVVERDVLRRIFDHRRRARGRRASAGVHHVIAHTDHGVSAGGGVEFALPNAQAVRGGAQQPRQSMQPQVVHRDVRERLPPQAPVDAVVQAPEDTHIRAGKEVSRVRRIKRDRVHQCIGERVRASAAVIGPPGSGAPCRWRAKSRCRTLVSRWRRRRWSSTHRHGRRSRTWWRASWGESRCRLSAPSPAAVSRMRGLSVGNCLRSHQPVGCPRNRVARWEQFLYNTAPQAVNAVGGCAHGAALVVVDLRADELVGVST